MKKLQLAHRIDIVNSSECTMGDIKFFGDFLIIPVVNLSLMDDLSLNDKLFRKGEYLNKSYLILEGIKTITWDYDTSRSIPAAKRYCFGGTLWRKKSYTEFWIEFHNGYVGVDLETESQKQMWNVSESVKDFFSKSADYEVLSYLFSK